MLHRTEKQHRFPLDVRRVHLTGSTIKEEYIRVTVILAGMVRSSDNFVPMANRVYVRWTPIYTV